MVKAVMEIPVRTPAPRISPQTLRLWARMPQVLAAVLLPSLMLPVASEAAMLGLGNPMQLCDSPRPFRLGVVLRQRAVPGFLITIMW